jgi:glutamate racemase
LNAAMNPPPIGVFDSGVGGLTVLRALRAAMPAEDFIYLGDTARLPYGTKSAETVVRYSQQCAARLVARGIRCLVVACNTASATSLAALRLLYPHMTVIGVIDAGAQAAVAASVSQHIAVIATEGTINGGAYQTAIRRLNASSRVTTGACSLFVALAEEGWTSGPIAEAVARRYLEPIFNNDHAPDTLVLGCTHFPVLAAAIRAALPAGVKLVDSAVTTAAAVLEQLHGGAERRMQVSTPGRTGRGNVTWLATDDAARFARVGSVFLGERLSASSIEIVDL